MRTINLTIKFEDSDLIEHSLRNTLQGLLGDSIIDIRTLPKTEHLRENKEYLALKKQEKIAKKLVYDFIDANRE